MTDKGHTELIEDLQALLKEAESKAFHDFENTEHAGPKFMLVSRFDRLKQKAMRGGYDNAKEKPDGNEERKAE